MKSAPRSGDEPDFAAAMNYWSVSAPRSGDEPANTIRAEVDEVSAPRSGDEPLTPERVAELRRVRPAQRG